MLSCLFDYAAQLLVLHKNTVRNGPAVYAGDGGCFA